MVGLGKIVLNMGDYVPSGQNYYEKTWDYRKKKLLLPLTINP